MNEEQIQELVKQLVAQLSNEEHAKVKGNAKILDTGFENLKNSMMNHSAGDCSVKDNVSGQDEYLLEDISQKDIRKWYLVENPAKKDVFMEMKLKTPARIGIGRAGARYKTETMLRVRADHAAAQDSVFSDVSEQFVKEQNMIPIKTLCKDKDEYLTRPDLGRRFGQEAKIVIEKICGKNPKVVIVVGDGLSSAAIEANVADMVPALKQGLELSGIHTGDVLFIKYARVGATDDIGEITGAQVVCMLVGERPGLVTAESMSAYITYAPKHGIAESKRTVISNIHRGGTNPAEAGAHAAELIVKMLEKKASGIDLKLMD